MSKCASVLALVLVPMSVLASDAAASGPSETAAWKAGLATVVITPEQSMWMAGYAARTKPSEGKVHDLYGKALALEDAEGTRLVILTAELIGIPREIRDWMEREVGERYGLPPDGLLINVSHTHCGPELRAWRASQTWDLPDEQIDASRRYADDLRIKLVEVVGKALDSLAPAKLSYTHARAGFAMNRRFHTGQRWVIRPNPDGPVDHDVPVLRVTDAKDRVQAIVFGYACHNTTLSFYDFCGDYSGFAQRYIEEAQPGAEAIFMAGCGGDQNPTPRRTLEWAQRHGRALANAVEAALEAQPQEVSGPLGLALDEAMLELAEPPSLGELRKQAESGNKYESRHAKEVLDEIERTGQVDSSYPYLVHVVRFGGDLTVVGLAGEVVVDYSLRLKEELPGPVWVAGYCNDVFGYVPSKRVLEEGGYEAKGAVIYYSTTPTPFAPSVEEGIVAKVHELIGSVSPRASRSHLVARIHDSGFPLSHDTYNGMVTASDGSIYYVLSSESFKTGCQMYRYDPTGDEIEHVGDITDACGEKDARTIVQGKVHVNPVESDGKLYFATHVGYYSIIDGMEKIGVPPEGWKPYPGGHFLSYDMTTGEFEDLATAPHGEGILTMAMDTKRGRLYGITWPTGRFLRYDLAKHDLKDLGPISRQGENGKGEDYRTICRSITVDRHDGSAYYTVGDGDIFRYRYDRDAIEETEGEDMRKDYFGLYDPTSPGHMAYNWRQTVWYELERAIYGVHGNSGYLFRFDPGAGQVRIVERLTSLPSKRSGMFDQFSYGYLGFALGPDGRTLYYLTGGPVYVDGKRVSGKKTTAMGESKGIENLHLVTYDIPAGKYTDHGPIFFEDGRRPYYVNAIAVGKDGTVYTLSRVTGGEHPKTDLISIRGVR